MLGHVEDWNEANGGGNGQDIAHNLLGSILRIDVDSGTPYGIPADNPFTGTAGCTDSVTRSLLTASATRIASPFDIGGAHRLFAGDAGQELWEEISIVDKGDNYGWNVKEGTHCFDTENPDGRSRSVPTLSATGIRVPATRSSTPSSSTRIITSQEGSAPPSSGNSFIEATCCPNYPAGTYSATGVGSSKSRTGHCLLRRPERRVCGRCRNSGSLLSRAAGSGTTYWGFGQDPAGEIYVGVTDNT